MRVRGIENLRVADMSACPNINAGNTAAPAMMLGDRCAEFILGAGAVTQSKAESASELT
jgi:choline dehydrogenase-like flavoprotein